MEMTIVSLCICMSLLKDKNFAVIAVIAQVIPGSA